MEKTKIQGEGEIIARFSNGETARVTTWLYIEFVKNQLWRL